MPPDRQPCQAQMIAVSKLRAGQREAEEGAQKLIVGEHGLHGLLRKRNDPAGSLRWLRRLPCGWHQIPRTFPSGPSTTVSRPSLGWQSPIFVARLRLVAVPYRVDDFLHSRLALGDGGFGRLWVLLKDLGAQRDTLVANKDAGARDKPDLVLALAAKGALPLDLSGHAANIGR